jgi:TRAP-type mannitol/chloroaromatic compound transport system permease small subunit
MKEYRFLKISRLIFKILSWLVLGMGIVFGIVVFVTGGGTPTVTADAQVIEATPKAAGFIIMIMGGFYFLILYTISEIINILLDLKSVCNKTTV